MNNKKYLEFIACFMIGLVLTIPFYISSVMAQDEEAGVPDAKQACIEKNEKTSKLVDLMDNGIIDYIEKILQLLQAISTIWESLKFIINSIIIPLYDYVYGAGAAKELEFFRIFKDNPLSISQGGMDLVHYLVTCKIPGNILTLCNINIPTGGGSSYKLPVDPYENIYTAIGCLCIPGILVNLRRLETMYKTHSCCIEQACSNGVNVENCEREFSIQQCMFWGKGALLGSLIALITKVMFSIILGALTLNWVKTKIPYAGTLVSIVLGAFKISDLMNAIKRAQKAFSDPNCEDLGFDKIQDEITQQYSQQDCSFRPVDLNRDGIFDTMDTVCTAQPSKFFDFND